MVLLLFLMFPLTGYAKTYVYNSKTPQIEIIINGKIANNRNKINLDSNENYIDLKSNYKNDSLKTDSKKVKLKYLGMGTDGKTWTVETKKTGKVRFKVLRKNKVVKCFTVIIKTPKLTYNKKTDLLKLKGAGEDSSTSHKLKWVFTPIGNYGCNGKKIVERSYDTTTTIPYSGVYKVQVKLLGKTYKLKKKVKILEIEDDFEVKRFSDLYGTLPEEILNSLYKHKYILEIVDKKSLDHFSPDLKKDYMVEGIHDLENRKISVCNTSAVIVLHEIGHFVSCSFQKVKGKNLTNTNEWNKIYRKEKDNFCPLSGMTKIGNTYAATSPNEFFAECFWQYYLNSGTLAKTCPQAYFFINRTVEKDFPAISNVAW